MALRNFRSSNVLPVAKKRRVIESLSNGDIALRITVFSLVMYGLTRSNSLSNDSPSMRRKFLKTSGSLILNSFNKGTWPNRSRHRYHCWAHFRLFRFCVLFNAMPRANAVYASMMTLGSKLKI